MGSQMQVNTSLEQHIAVFGESGSGKTVLLSSFYGPTQEPGFEKENLYEVIAQDAAKGRILHANYLGMRDYRQVPEPNKFKSHSYSFKITPKASPGTSPTVDSLQLVWHDYPGEWFEQEVESEEEAQRRVDTFRSLLRSDVAFLLVDAQRLIDNTGQEEAYLKALFTNFHTGLKRLKGDILENGERLVEFPRIWVVALSKADLLPDLDVYGFQQLVISKATGELNRLGETISEMVQGEAALSVGDDFVLFSSARFTPERIDLTNRVGIDLVLPLAAILPFERHAKWVEQKSINKIPDTVIENLVGGAGVLIALLAGKKLPLPGPFGRIAGLIGAVFTKDLIDGLLTMAKDKLQDAKKQALQKHQYFTAVLTGFRLALIKGEEALVLRRSRL